MFYGLGLDSVTVVSYALWKRIEPSDGDCL